MKDIVKSFDWASVFKSIAWTAVWFILLLLAGCIAWRTSMGFICTLVLTMAFSAVWLIVVLMTIVMPSGDQPEEDTVQKSKEYCAIRSDHGDTIGEVMEAIRHEQYEYRAIFNLREEKLAEGTFLSPETCNLVAEDWQDIDAEGEEIIDFT